MTDFDDPERTARNLERRSRLMRNSQEIVKALRLFEVDPDDETIKTLGILRRSVDYFLLGGKLATQKAIEDLGARESLLKTLAEIEKALR